MKARYEEVKQRGILIIEEYFTDRLLDKDDEEHDIIQRLLSPSQTFQNESEMDGGELDDKIR